MLKHPLLLGAAAAARGGEGGGGRRHPAAAARAPASSAQGAASGAWRSIAPPASVSACASIPWRGTCTPRPSPGRSSARTSSPCDACALVGGTATLWVASALVGCTVTVEAGCPVWVSSAWRHGLDDLSLLKWSPGAAVVPKGPWTLRGAAPWSWAARAWTKPCCWAGTTAAPWPLAAAPDEAVKLSWCCAAKLGGCGDIERLLAPSWSESLLRGWRGLVVSPPASSRLAA